MGTDSKIGLSTSMAATPPMADARLPITVMPTCTVARNLSGSSFNLFTTSAECIPFFDNSSNLLLLADIMAISEPEKNPFAKINSNIITASISKPSKDIVPPLIFKVVGRLILLV